MAELGDDGEPDSYVDVDVQIKTEAEYEYGLEGPEGECLISSDSEREQRGCGDRQYRRPGGDERGMTIKKLWRRIRRLEEQVASCLENQPLLYQVIGKCKAIEQRQKVWKLEVDMRLKEISNGLKSQGLEIEASDRNRTATKSSLKRKHRSAASPPISESDIDLSENNDIYNDLAVGGSDGPDSDYEPQKRVANSNIKTRKFTHNSISASSFRSPQDSTERNNSFPCKLCPEQDQVFRTAKDLAEHYCHQHPHPKNQPPVQRAQRGRPRKSATTNSGKPEPHTKQCATVHADDSFPDIPDLDLIDTLVTQAVDNETGEFPCPDGCGNVSRTKNLLRRHLTSCRRLRPFKCDECDKDFQTKGRLNEHKRCAHEKVRNVDCPICGRSMDKYQIKYHVMLHYKEKPHLCDTCGAGFTRPDTLRVHRRTHTEERPFRCPHSGCDKEYKNDTSLNRHFAKTGHSAGVEGKTRSHVCDVCGWAFRSAGGLKTHMERHQRETNAKGRSGRGASSKSKPTTSNEPPPEPQIIDSE